MDKIYYACFRINVRRSTYLLLAIYCRKHFNERVSIAKVRQLRNKIKNELRHTGFVAPEPAHTRGKEGEDHYAKT